MPKTRVGINGFGRMGRLALRFALSSPDLEVVLVNEINGGVETAAYLLEFDSVHGRLQKPVKVLSPSLFEVGDHPIMFTELSLPGEVPWEASRVEVVLECSGEFRTVEALQGFFGRGVRRVVVSAPVKDPTVPNIVVGCNEGEIGPENRIVTAASCTTNCIAPVIGAIDARFKIVRGCITTIHDVTNTQTLVDAPNTKKKDLRRARAGLMNLAPTSTGSATAIALIYPHLKGKLNGVAIRVPLQNASIADLVLHVETQCTAEEVNTCLREASERLPQVLGYEERPLVSTDFTNDERSSVVDAPSTMVVDGSMVKILAWYDNEPVLLPGPYPPRSIGHGAERFRLTLADVAGTRTRSAWSRSRRL